MAKNKKDKIENEDKKLTKRGAVQEGATKTEKIVTYVLIGAALLAVLLIFIFALLSGGEKQKIARRYDSLTKDNVYTLVTYDKFQEKVQNGDDFEVVLVSEKQAGTNYFVYCVDMIVKQYKSSEEYDVSGEIFLLNVDKLSDDERKFFTNIDKRLLNDPIIVHFKPILKAQSVDFDKSNNYHLDEYGNNVFALLQKYFENNFEKLNSDD